MKGIRRSRNVNVWVKVAVAGVLAVSLAAMLPAVTASADDPTVSYEPLRTGWDQHEPGLSPSAVSASDFGPLYSTAVDGQVYAQPVVAGGTLVAATENDKVYGMNPATGTIGWTRDVGPSWPASTTGCGDLVPNIGITATPVYDPSTGTVYLTAKVNDGVDAAHPHWYMHALAAATGVERPGWPVSIQGTPDNDPTHPFNPEFEMQRPGLLLLGGVVYAAFGSNCDHEPYVGDVVGISASTGARTALWSDEAGTSTNEAGIWQSGGGLVSDGPGRILLTTGNGVSPPPGPGDSPPSTLAESVVRLGVNSNGTLTPQSYFSPYNNTKLDLEDADLGSGGPMELPPGFGTAAHPRLVVQAGKDGRVFLLDADHLGGTNQKPGGGDNVLETAGPFKGVWGHPAFWGGGSGYVYSVETGGYLRALQYGVTGTGAPSLTSVGTSAGTFGFGSGSPVVTSNGTTANSALVWVVYSQGPNISGAQLQAYDAVPQAGVLKQVYTAPIGIAAKFSVPATDGGRVFVGTGDGHVLGFGHPTTAVLQASPTDFGQVGVNTTANGTVTVKATQNVTVSAVSTAAPFATPTFQSTLVAAGQTLTVPVSFTPTVAGAESASLSFVTDQGTVNEELAGTGTEPGLGAQPPSLSFTGVPAGSTQMLNVDIVNTGTTPETVQSVTAPPAPFTASGLPPPQSIIPAQGSVSVSVSYAPTTSSSASANLIVNSDMGTVTVPLEGTAVAGSAHLSIQPDPLNAGKVPIGESSTMRFIVSNTGNIPLTLTKAAPPAGVFTAKRPISEGQQLGPGGAINEIVTFTPVTTGPATATYQITSDDGQGQQSEQLTGTGTHDPVGDYYDQLGGAASYLGVPTDAVHPVAGGEGQDFVGGSIFWSAATGPHAVHGAILAHYQALGGPGGVLGFPVTDETGTPDGVGRFNHFAKDGSIYWTPATGAWSVHGAIQDHYAALGWERGPLGYPVTDETGTLDGVGRFNKFSNDGSIYWTPSTGAWSVHGAIYNVWAAMGSERSTLGYPTSDEYAIPGGRQNNFVSGTISWNAATGATSVSLH